MTNKDKQNENIEKQKKLIHGNGWDYLIILDDCRYDFFEEISSEYFSGSLKKVESEGSETIEWLKKTFPDTYDITYISGNPFVNSKGVEAEGYNATDHFKKIVDVWDFGWDDNKGTVPPEEMVTASLNEEMDTQKCIIHFIQPHRPFLSEEDPHSLGLRKKIQERTWKTRLRGWLSNKLSSIIGKEKTRYISWLIFGTDFRAYEKILSEWGAKKILNLYEDNLKKALESVSFLVKNLNGRIIITADHGESFGEEGIWGHPRNSKNPSLINVPWLEIK